MKPLGMSMSAATKAFDKIGGAIGASAKAIGDALAAAGITEMPWPTPKAPSFRIKRDDVELVTLTRDRHRPVNIPVYRDAPARARETGHPSIFFEKVVNGRELAQFLDEQIASRIAELPTDAANFFRDDELVALVKSGNLQRAGAGRFLWDCLRHSGEEARRRRVDIPVLSFRDPHPVRPFTDKWSGGFHAFVVDALAIVRMAPWAGTVTRSPEIDSYENVRHIMACIFRELVARKRLARFEVGVDIVPPAVSPSFAVWHLDDAPSSADPSWAWQERDLDLDEEINIVKRWPSTPIPDDEEDIDP